MTILIAVGVGLILFGAVVLLRFADRPGGSFKWMGMELTSKGAGLPLIALGVVCIALAATRGAPPDDKEKAAPKQQTAGPTTTPGQTTTCTITDSIPQERVVAVDVGMSNVPVIAAGQPLEEPFVVVLGDGIPTLGALRVRLTQGPNSSADLYRIEQAVDDKCQPVREMRNTSRGGDGRQLLNWDTVRLRLGEHEYDLRIGGEGNITVARFDRVG
ncbi:MAG TPA: hypothetical protein VFQ45_01180 [Longimicrobium sp.]|nr:hypothetical protein [Longimicrobium sp.]